VNFLSSSLGCYFSACIVLVLYKYAAVFEILFPIVSQNSLGIYNSTFACTMFVTFPTVLLSFISFPEQTFISSLEQAFISSL
jgi:malic enzyme